MIQIIGGGPAGSTCAYYLAKKGFDVNLYEKSPDERKPCGGGLSWRIFNEFPDIINQINIPLRPVETIHLIYNDKLKVVKTDKPIGRITDRLILDNQLRKLAEKYGCKIIEKRADTKDFNNGIIVDARGFYPCKKKAFIMTSVCRLKDTEFTLAYYEKFNKIGYFWIFPLSDKLANIGVGEVDQRLFKQLPNTFEWWADKLNAKIKERKACMESLEANKNIFEKTNEKLVVKIGERAGLVDPLTCEGIYYAMKSGKVLADSIIAGDFSEYTKFLDSIKQRFFIYRLIRNFIFLFPHKKLLGKIVSNILLKKSQSFLFRFY